MDGWMDGSLMGELHLPYLWHQTDPPATCLHMPWKCNSTLSSLISIMWVSLDLPYHHSRRRVRSVIRTPQHLNYAANSQINDKTPHFFWFSKAKYLQDTSRSPAAGWQRVCVCVVVEGHVITLFLTFAAWAKAWMDMEDVAVSQEQQAGRAVAALPNTHACTSWGQLQTHMQTG